MSYEESGATVRVVAGVDVRHGAIAADDGQVGRVIKTQTPAQDTLRANRNLVVAGEAYNIRVRGVCEVDNTNLSGIAKGALVYIRTTDNAIANASGANYVVLGKVVCLPGERACPANRVRVDLEQKA